MSWFKKHEPPKALPVLSVNDPEWARMIESRLRDMQTLYARHVEIVNWLNQEFKRQQDREAILDEKIKYISDQFLEVDELAKKTCESLEKADEKILAEAFARFLKK